MGPRGRTRTRLSRRAFAGGTALALIGALSACSQDRIEVELVRGGPPSTVLPGQDPARTALALSTALFESADVAVLATEDTLEQLAPLGAAGGLPLLIGADDAVAAELERLGAGTVLVAPGTEPGALGEGIEVLELDPGADGVELPEVRRRNHPVAVTLCVDPSAPSPTRQLADSVVTAAGGTVIESPGGAVGHSGEALRAIREAAGEDPSTGVLALGTGFGAAEAWVPALQRVLAAPELPGGGITAFPGRRMIAAYGTPGSPGLGILGEQGLKESIARVQRLAAEYADLTEETVIPAFEIISTIADSDPGADGDYSRALAPEALREWVDAAGEAGVYVVLDLQPGTTDFLTQAKLYEELLLAPHVGLALDPEWRLRPGQQHLEQIGSVSAAEINRVSTWLADLTAREGLPQKVLILHQFTRSMISDRQDVDTSRPELAITLHADGHGTPEDKLSTYRALQRDLPDGIVMSWKNFYDEDLPTFTPQQTYAVEPRPWFVSYQ